MDKKSVNLDNEFYKNIKTEETEMLRLKMLERINLCKNCLRLTPERDRSKSDYIKYYTLLGLYAEMFGYKDIVWGDI